MQVIDVRDHAREHGGRVWKRACWYRPAMARRNYASSNNGSRPGPARRPTSHSVEEVLTVREGEAEMWLEEQRVIVSAGQSLIVPAGRKHGFRNSGNVTLHIHAVLAVAGFRGHHGRRNRTGAAVG